MLAATLVGMPATAGTDLLEVLTAAEQMDPFYRAAQNDALATAEGVPQARASLWMPEIAFSFGAPLFDKIRKQLIVISMQWFINQQHQTYCLAFR